METEWNEDKNAANRAKHGLDFASFEGFDGTPVAVVRDDRYDYGEDRFIALGRIGGVPHAVVYTLRGETMRLISFRRAHEEEIARHE
jgi:uncharacterized DUF497 family protein